MIIKLSTIVTKESELHAFSWTEGSNVNKTMKLNGFMFCLLLSVHQTSAHTVLLHKYFYLTAIITHCWKLYPNDNKQLLVPRSWNKVNPPLHECHTNRNKLFPTIKGLRLFFFLIFYSLQNVHTYYYFFQYSLKKSFSIVGNALLCQRAGDDWQSSDVSLSDKLLQTAAV